MNLQVRDPEVHRLASRLARLQGKTMTAAVRAALEDAVARAEQDRDGDLHERIAVITKRLRAKARPGGRDLTKDELHALWIGEEDTEA